LELINLKNVSLLQFEEVIRKTTKVEKISENFIAPTSIVGDGTRTKEKYGSS